MKWKFSKTVFDAMTLQHRQHESWKFYDSMFSELRERYRRRSQRPQLYFMLTGTR